MSSTASSSTTGKPGRKRWVIIGLALALGALATVGIAALLLSVFERRQEAEQPYFKVVELDESTSDPAVWGQNFPIQYETFLQTSEMPEDERQYQEPTEQDPREYKAHSKLEKDPRLITMWQGYAFSVEYNEPRGHEYMLQDQQLVKRITDFEQPGTCLNCHASTVTIMNDLGNGDLQAGFDAMNKLPYEEAAALAEHPVSCIDCHDPDTMALRISRPAFMEGMRTYQASQDIKDYDVNRDASAQDMRNYVCAQCHVEYYFAGEGKTLTFPWEQGLTVDDAYTYYNEVDHTDFVHRWTSANIIKAQHPDFETFSQGPHANAGVTCADCHMPYEREGAMKVTDHQVASPMRSEESINTTCLTCHNATESEMQERVTRIHDEYWKQEDIAFDALDALIMDIKEAQEAGDVPEEQLDAARGWQRRASFLMDYSVSENSDGFHAPAYSNGIMNEVTDASRRGQLALRGEGPGPDLGNASGTGEVAPNAPGPELDEYPNADPANTEDTGANEREEERSN